MKERPKGVRPLSAERGLTPRGVISLWLPVLAYTAFIFWLSSAPRPAPPLLRWPGADKLVHLGEYIPLGVLLLRAFGGSQFPAALASGTTIGALDEMFQGFVPTRHMSSWDLLADVAGVVIGVVIYRWKRAKTP